MKYSTIPFILELVNDTNCIEFIIIRTPDGKVVDVANDLQYATDRIAEIMDELFSMKNSKDET